jgi:DNA-binding transcriptional MerR regulator
MLMNASYDICEVARETGLTQRALRFYEKKGLVAPLRTEGGRRVYGPGELARLNAAVALKRAGFSLEQIANMLSGRQVDLAGLVAAQLTHIAKQSATLVQSRTLLMSVQERLVRGDRIDIATLCSLIRSGKTIMDSDDWAPVVDAYFTAEEQGRFRAAMPEAFNGDEYNERWRRLGAQIEAALPVDLMSEQAQAFVDQWFALLRPFSDTATPEMWNGVARMYDDRPEWQSQPDAGFSHEVWTFIRSATRARIDAGGVVDGPAWMTPSHPA